MSIPKQSGSASTAPRIDYDPFSVNAMSDPYALYGELRARQPVYELPHYEAFALSRFASSSTAVSVVTNPGRSTHHS